jgi:membrane protease YdiL (CAAX protease family)
VAFIEETFLRGAMFTGIERSSGATVAIGLTAFVYAALHFLNRVKIPAEQVDSDSGIELLAGTFDTFMDPAAIVDSFLALFAVGVLLALVRARTGNIAACVGLHAGWVWIIAITRELTRRDPASEWAYLVGSYDGIVGYFVFGWTALMVAAACFILRPAAPAGRQ